MSDLPSPVMQQALECLRAGRTVAAEELVLSALRDVVASQGEHSPAYATAQNDLGVVCLYVRQVERAIEAFRAAVGVEAAGDESAERDRLTFCLNLAHALCEAGRLDEAEDVLTGSLPSRETIYGLRHSGYAFGLEPLAEVLLKKRNLEAALEAADACVDVFSSAGHPRLTTSLALRAEIAQLLRQPLFQGAFADLQLPPPTLAELVGAVVNRTEQASLSVSQGLLSAALPIFSAALDPLHPAVVQMRIALGNLLGRGGDHAGHAVLLASLVEELRGAGQLELALQTNLGLAFALANAEEHAAAQVAYDAARVLASQLGSDPLASQVLRNQGLHLNEIGHCFLGESALRRALDLAEADSSLRGKAAVALGIALQHGGDLSEAEALLRDGLSLLGHDEPDRICARSHLSAIVDGGECGCSGRERLDQALSTSLEELVRGEAPEGLLGKVELRHPPDGGEPQISIVLAREPQGDEIERLDRVLRHALERIRRRIREG
jgi:tetratricopeptide (TPR) repeat protein